MATDYLATSIMIYASICILFRFCKLICGSVANETLKQRRIACKFITYWEVKGLITDGHMVGASAAP